MKRVLAAALILFFATPVAAHSPLEATVPAHGAVVTDVPAEIAMEFKGAIRLTRVTLTHAGKDSRDLDLDGGSGFVPRYALPLPALGAGLYQIEWRGLGSDGHAMNGTFSFTVGD